MSVIVNDTGFVLDDWAGHSANDNGHTVDLASDASRKDAMALMDASMIRVQFSSFADGRGFTLAAILRRAGYRGRLRAVGHVLADQYAMARRSGFDDVEISDALAARQPEDQWLARANWRAHDYQARLRHSAAPA